MKRQQQAKNSVEGQRIFRLIDGYDAAPLYFYRTLRSPEATVRLNTVVKGIRWRKGRVEAECTRSGEGLAQIRAACAVITVPLSILQCLEGEPGTIRFDPEPVEIRDSAARLAMGNAVRVTLWFRTAFWQRRREYAMCAAFRAERTEVVEELAGWHWHDCSITKRGNTTAGK